MKNKDLSQENGDRDKDKKNPRTKKLGDKIGPVHHEPSQKGESKSSNKEEDFDKSDKSREDQ